MLVTLGTCGPGDAPATTRRSGRGGCTGSADWKLKVKPDDGRLEVEAEVDSNVSGQTWRWRLCHNGSVSARGTSTTPGAVSGSFEVERRMSTWPGPTVRFRANHRTARSVAAAISW